MTTKMQSSVQFNPEFDHGQYVRAGTDEGIVLHRRFTGRYWEYGVLFDGYSSIQWRQNLTKISLWQLDNDENSCYN